MAADDWGNICVLRANKKLSLRDFLFALFAKNRRLLVLHTRSVVKNTQLQV